MLARAVGAQTARNTAVKTLEDAAERCRASCRLLCIEMVGADEIDRLLADPGRKTGDASHMTSLHPCCHGSWPGVAGVFFSRTITPSALAMPGYE